MDFYKALARRFRLDLDEWFEAHQDDSPVSGIKKFKKLQKKLNLIKEYLDCSKKSLDIHLTRDAYKRLANMYIEISQGPPPFGNADEEVFASKEDLELTTQLEIQDNEQNDLSWLRKFSKARALFFIAK